MRRLLILALCLILLCGCTQPEKELTKYNATFLDLFDTVTTVVGYAENEESFTAMANGIRDDLRYYHQLFDIYNSYEGLNNLKTVNDQAGIAPVKVDPAIVALLSDCKQYYAQTEGMVNVAMGSVLVLWHHARNDGLMDPLNAYLPKEEALLEAARHRDMDCLVIDEENATVFLTDPAARLDVGAVAKGWSAQRVAETAPAGLLLSVGGNVCATGPKADGSPWVIGVQSPDDPASYLHTLNISSGSVVTSGDYQRAFVVEGQVYHHIIDPATLYPGKLWRSVTIVCPDSGLADALSTALFLLPLEEGQALLESTGAEAMWVGPEGEQFYSPGFHDLIRN